MKRISRVLAIGLMVSACSHEPQEFRIKVEAPIIGTQQITAVYTTDDGNRRSISVPAVEGAFELVGSSSIPSVIEIFTSNKQLFAAIIAKNGESLTLREVEGGFDVEGSETAQILANYKLGNDTIGMPIEVRQAIDIVYTEHSREDYPKFEAPELIFGRDSIATLPVEGVWVFTSSLSERTGSLLDTLKVRSKEEKPVRDVFIGTDTVSWRIYTRRDSATWTQAMLPDGPLKLRGILTSTPLLVEVDSLGGVTRVQRLE